MLLLMSFVILTDSMDNRELPIIIGDKKLFCTCYYSGLKNSLGVTGYPFPPCLYYMVRPVPGLVESVRPATCKCSIFTFTSLWWLWPFIPIWLWGGLRSMFIGVQGF